MNTTLNFQKTILDQLEPSSYVLLDPIALKGEEEYLSILFNKEDLKPFVQQLKKLPDLSNINVASTFKHSKGVLKFLDNNVEKIIIFVHKFAYKSLIYLDEKEVMQKRVRKSDGCYIPCVEHIFEMKVLRSFLNMKGISRESFQYFSEFHILVQEDLLEYF